MIDRQGCPPSLPVAPALRCGCRLLIDTHAPKVLPSQSRRAAEMHLTDASHTHTHSRPHCPTAPAPALVPREGGRVEEGRYASQSNDNQASRTRARPTLFRPEPTRGHAAAAAGGSGGRFCKRGGSGERVVVAVLWQCLDSGVRGGRSDCLCVLTGSAARR
jgi:hypothetical protein